MAFNIFTDLWLQFQIVFPTLKRDPKCVSSERPWWLVVKSPPANAGDVGSIPGSGRSPEGVGYPLWYSCLENPMGGGALGTTAHVVTKELDSTWASLVAQMVKSLPAVQQTRVQSLGREGPLEKEMAIHLRILAGKIPWTEEPGRLQSMRPQRVRHDWVTSLSLSLGLNNNNLLP